MRPIVYPSRSQLLQLCLWLVWFHACPNIAQSQEYRVAILGDSITYDGGWAVRVEAAMRALPQFRTAEIVNLGLPSETISGLSEPGHAGGKFPRPCLHERLDRILTFFRPNLVLACYGMNCGIYQPLDPSRMKSYQEGMIRLKQAVEKNGGTIVFISPSIFQADQPQSDKLGYDQVLDAQAAWLKQMQQNSEWRVVDIRPQLRRLIADQKQQNPNFVFSSDGVHPSAEGQAMLARSICPELWRQMSWPGNSELDIDFALQPLAQRANLLKHAWLSHIGHQRPGIAEGKSLEIADREGIPLLEQFLQNISISTSRWEGFERLDFKYQDRNALLVKPLKPSEKLPWIWRTEFFGHQPQADIALLNAGYHVAYIDLQNMYGAPAALTIMDSFHQHLVSTYGLNRRVVLEGFSRGGLFAFNWAATRPQHCAALYVDAPVCDFKSWPGGKGMGPGSATDWQQLLKVYGLTEAEALAYRQNPVDTATVLANEKIPVIAVVGEADEVVPVSENIDLVEARLQAAGGLIKVIRKPGVKHHPHSLSDPTPIVEFLRQQALLEDNLKPQN